MRLRTLLAVTFALLALILSLVGSLAIQQVVTRRLENRIGNDMAQLAGQVRNLLDANLAERVSDMKVLAELARTAARSSETKRYWVDALKRVYPVYAWIGFVRRDGIVEASTDGILGGADVSARPWFKAGLEAPVFGDVHEALLLASKLPPSPDGEPLRFVDAATPVRDDAGSVVGVVGGHLSWKWVSVVTQEARVALARRNPDLQLIVLSSKGEVLLSTKPLQGGDIASTFDVTRDAGAPEGAAVDHRTVELGGRPYLAGTSRSRRAGSEPALGWTVLVLQPAEAALAPSRQLSLEIMALGCALAGLAALVGWWLAGRIAAPLLNLSKAARVSDDHAIALPPATGFDEVRELTEAIGTLMSRVAQRDAALAAANRGLEERVAERTGDLAKSTAFVTSIVDTTPDGVLVLGLGGEIEFLNAGACAIFRLAGRDDVVGRAFAACLPPADADEIREGVAAAGAGRPGHLVAVLPSDFDTHRWCDLSLTPIVGPDGRPERILVLARDITALKAGEAQWRAACDLAELERGRAEHAGQVKAEFLANMSHELRTPLTGMLGVHDLLREDASLGSRQRQLVGLAQEAGRSLLVIVNDVLDFSKIDAGQLAIERVVYDLRHVVEGCRRIGQESCAGRAIAVEAEVSRDVPARLMGDPTRVKQILLNLVTNAVKFTEAGSVRILVEAREGRLRVSVSDTGIGIAPAAVPFLFERFSQADGSTTRRFGGTGLGLAICKRLVEMMGGAIGVETRSGAGSTFRFDLPLDAAPDLSLEPSSGADGEVSGGAPPPAGGVTPRRILLAEDNTLNRQIIQTVLERAGHAVATAADGYEAVRAFRAGGFDVLLMDVQMPGCDGLTATRTIRGIEAVEGRRRIPIVALTANAMAEEVERCRLADMDSHVAKPVNWTALQTTIESLCQAAARPPGEAPAGGGSPPCPVLDEETLGLLAEIMGRERIGGLLSAFRAETERRLAGMGGPASSAAQLSADAHVFVAMAGQLGFAEMSAYCATLETADLTAGYDRQVAELRRVAERALRAADASSYRQAA